MIKTLTNLLKQDKEKFVVPKGVQDCIPITAIYDDGIFRVGKDKYSKSFKFTDINFAVASREDKEAMFLEYSELLNSLDSGATTKLTINNRRLNRLDFEKTILIPETGDELDVYREEYNKMLLDKATGATLLLPHFSCHSLRHTFTTRMCEAGVNVKVIQDTLGHKDISTTLNIYTDVTKELRKSEFEGLDSYFKNEYNKVSV